MMPIRFNNPANNSTIYYSDGWGYNPDIQYSALDIHSQAMCRLYVLEGLLGLPCSTGEANIMLNARALMVLGYRKAHNGRLLI